MDDLASSTMSDGGAAVSLDEAHLKQIGAVFWTLAIGSVTVVYMLSGGQLTAIGWRDATLILLRTFAGVLAFFVVFPVLLWILRTVNPR